MGGFNGGSNPLMRAGAQAIDAKLGVPVASIALSAAEANAGQRAQQAAVKAGYERQTELLRRQEARQLKDREDLLRRATASQRARMGALGIGSAGGSSDALIQSLQRRNAEEVSDIQAGFADRYSMLDWNFQQQQDEFEQARKKQMLSQMMPIIDILDDKKKAGKRQGGGEGGVPPYTPGRPPGGFNIL